MPETMMISGPRFYEPKPVLPVEAMRYTPDDLEACERLHEWLGYDHEDHEPDDLELYVEDAICYPGDWVVKVGENAFDVVSDDIFQSTYVVD